MSCVNGQMNECTERKLGQGLSGQVSRSWVLLSCVYSVCCGWCGWYFVVWVVFCCWCVLWAMWFFVCGWVGGFVFGGGHFLVVLLSTNNKNSNNKVSSTNSFP